MIRKRNKLDLYETEKGITQVLFNTIDISNQIVLEPCVGPGAISTVLRTKTQFVVTNDISHAHTADWHLDATNRKSVFWSTSYDWAISNPPFSVAPAIVENALETARVGVAMLLRLSFIEPCKNRRRLLGLYKDNFRYLVPLNPRPKFRSDTNNSDNATVAWFVWDKHWSWKEQGIVCPFRFAIDWR